MSTNTTCIHEAATNRRRFALGLLAVAGAGVAADAQPFNAQANRRFIDAAFGRWAAGGTGFFNEVLREDAVWTIIGSGPSAGTYHGRQDFIDRAIAPFAARMATPVRPVSRMVWADGEHVIARWDGEGVAGDGRPYRNSYVWIFRMRDGRAAEVTAFLDLALYDEVLRRVPARPASPPRSQGRD
ncbi:nuclear transport factor 2 family protein [Massilia sp. METH4]|uniref:nuclear transport factor 2 family protein n=1 Tax=Massilia sp. METH4 TaxID=3123041 RepID=UPI0030D5980A